MRNIRLALAALIPLAFLAPEAASAQSPDTDIFVAEISGTTSSPTFSGWRNVTRRAGYDNQPGFSTDSRAIFYTVQESGQTDIYRHDLDSGRNEQVTTTPEKLVICVGDWLPELDPPGVNSEASPVTLTASPIATCGPGLLPVKTKMASEVAMSLSPFGS